MAAAKALAFRNTTDNFRVGVWVKSELTLCQSRPFTRQLYAKSENVKTLYMVYITLSKPRGST